MEQEPAIEEFYRELPREHDQSVPTGLPGGNAQHLRIWYQNGCTIVLSVGEPQNASPYIYKGIHSTACVLQWYLEAMKEE